MYWNTQKKKRDGRANRKEGNGKKEETTVQTREIDRAHTHTHKIQVEEEEEEEPAILQKKGKTYPVALDQLAVFQRDVVADRKSELHGFNLTE